VNACLPALRELTDARLVTVVDTREKEPLIFNRFESVPGTLISGDYSVLGLEQLFAVERKSIDDLVGCMGENQSRFERELQRLRGFRFKRLLILHLAL
jgi:ERCC4-type nuclease